MSRLSEFLSDEGRVSVAEQVMERSKLAGRTHHVPFVHRDWSRPGPPEEHAAVHDYVHGVLIAEGHPPELARQIRVQPQDWDARQGGQAMTDGYNKIGLAGEHTNDMTLLHECAHILEGQGGHGHGPAFVQRLHGLYERHLGPEAATTFANLARRPM